MTIDSPNLDDILDSDTYNSVYPTVLFIPGLNQTQKGITVTLNVDAYAKLGQNNFISLNWPSGSVLGSPVDVLLSYLNSTLTVLNVRCVSYLNVLNLQLIAYELCSPFLSGG